MAQCIKVCKNEGAMKLLPWILAPLLLAATSLPDWAKAARSLTGEGDAGRATALQKLKAMPGIEATLKEALEGEQRFLALDAIVALGLDSLFDDVLRMSAADRSGFSCLALDALAGPSRLPALAQTYRERLLDRGTSAAAKVVILDSLVRMRERLHPDLLGALLEDASPEVRSAALYYLRGSLVTYRDPELVPLLRRVLEGRLSRQLRVQALALVSELSEGELSSLGPVKIACSGDLPANLESACERLRAR